MTLAGGYWNVVKAFNSEFGFCLLGEIMRSLCMSFYILQDTASLQAADLQAKSELVKN